MKNNRWAGRVYPLNSRVLECYEFIKGFSKNHNRMPTTFEVGDELNVGKQWITKMMGVLVREGYLEKIQRGHYQIVAKK